MAIRRKLPALLLVLGLSLAAAPTLGADEEGHPTAAELLQQGLSQLEQDQLDQARTTLLRVDPVQLNKPQRQKLQDALKRLREQRRRQSAEDADQSRTESEQDQPDASESADQAEQQQQQPDEQKPSEEQAELRPDQPEKAEPHPADADEAEDQPAPDKQSKQKQQKKKKKKSKQQPAPKTKQQKTAQKKTSDKQATTKQSPQGQSNQQKTAKVERNQKKQQKATDSQKLLDQALKLRTQQLIAEAAQARKDGQYNRATKLYQQALDLAPENQQAKKGLETVRALLDRGGEGRNLVDDYVGTVQLRAEQAKARFEEAMSSARKQRKQGNYQAALDAVSLAKAIAETNRQYLSSSEYERMAEQAESFSATLDQLAERAEARKKAKTEQQVEAEQTVRRRRAEKERQRKVQELLRRAANLRKELKYEQALDVLEQLLFLDPDNIGAKAMKEMIEDTIILRNANEINRKRNLNIAKHSVLNRQAAIPPTNIMEYPPDWPQLTAMREQRTGQKGAGSEADRQVREKLQQEVPVTFDGNRLENVIEYLRNVTGVNFFVNWRALEGAGVQPGSTVTLQLEQVPAEKALRLILDQVSGAVNLGFTVDDGVVSISTEENLGRNTSIRTYDIRDLVVQAPSFSEAPDFDLDEITRGSGGGGGGGSRGGGGGGGGGGGIFEDEQDQQDEQQSRQQMIQQVTQLIRDTVSPDSWRANGGLVSSMNEMNGSLIVNTTPQNHRQVGDLLDQLRETRAIQINVEARFLLVDQNYLDEVGMDMDFSISPELLGGDFEDPITIEQDTVNLADRQNTGIAGSFGETGSGGPQITGQGGQSATPGGQSQSFRRSVNINANLLSDVQVDLLIRATQANRRATSLTAPRVTFFNGQRAYVMVATQLSYISDLDPVVGTESASFDPQIGVVSSGVILDVQGTVSADRRYVTLTARPSLADVLRLRQIPITAAQSGGGGGGDNQDGEDGNQQESLTGLIEAPELQLTTVRTTVSVPDKGTLLMGGQRLMADVETEAGVPVLSKIPYVNRLFTNRSTVKDERTLLILIKPTILIQDEKERQLFPGLEQGPQMFSGSPRAPRSGSNAAGVRRNDVREEAAGVRGGGQQPQAAGARGGGGS